MKFLKKFNENKTRNMLKYKNIKFVDVDDWDDLVSQTYGKPYSFQQQEGCQSRGTVNLTIPSDYDNDKKMNDSIPEIVNGDEMGVKFSVWLARDPKQPMQNQKSGGTTGDFYKSAIADLDLNLFWTRNFYPDLQTVANDLYNKGLIESGEYTIDIDW